MLSRRFLAGLFVVLFAGLAIVSGAFFLQVRKDLRAHQAVEAKNRQVLASRQAELRDQERRLERLRTDRDYVEREIRRVLKYARPDEYVFRFDAGEP